MRIMKNKIKGLLIIASTALLPIVSVLAADDSNDIADTIKEIRELLTVIGGALAILGFVVAGLMMTISYESEENVKKAKDIIKWSMVGLAVVLMAKALSAIVEGVVVK